MEQRTMQMGRECASGALDELQASLKAFVLPRYNVQRPVSIQYGLQP